MKVKNETFAISDVNLKFNKPEVMLLSTERKKSESLGISVIDIAQTLQLSLSGQRFGYFMKMENNIRLLDNLIKRSFETIGFNLYVKIVWDNSFKWIT
jgi:multidrug efflux pump subunit AcrB